MKITQLQLERFKRFRENFVLDFTDPDSNLPLDLVVLVGENGSGKSSVFQAIAITLGLATSTIKKPEDFSYPGFEYKSISAAYRGYANIRLTVQFEIPEIDATHDYYRKSSYSTHENAVEPGNSKVVILSFSNSPDVEYPVQGYFPEQQRSNAAAVFQFRGRQYAFSILSQRIPNMFENVGGFFWYDEQRTTSSFNPATYGGYNSGYSSAYNPELSSVAATRQLLANWNAESSRKKNKFTRLQELYSLAFPGRKLSRVGETFGLQPPPIFFDDGNNEYELAEVSGGERALLPFLIDFANWGIHNSIILIDELELHLHPPLQQTLLTLLPRLGKNNQFFITTHSDAIAALVPESNIRRISIGNKEWA